MDPTLPQKKDPMEHLEPWKAQVERTMLDAQIALPQLLVKVK